MVHGPDGRIWQVRRRPQRPGPFATLLPGPWYVDAEAGEEARRWEAPSRGAARELVNDVALALRTGADGPPGEVAVDDDPDSTGGP